MFCGVVAVGKRGYNALDKKARTIWIGRYRISIQSVQTVHKHHLKEGGLRTALGLREIDISDNHPNRMDTGPLMRVLTEVGAA